MKKLLAVAIALAVVAVAMVSVNAEGIGAQNAVKARIRTLGALGNGLAISQSNPMDFELLKIGIAKVSLTISGMEDNVSVGILYFGDTRYALKEVTIGNGTASANVYSNGTQVGSISLSSYPKGDTEIWAGTLTLNGVAYNAYVIQAHPIIKAAEVADKVKTYCENNPEKCKAVMKAVGQVICDPATDGSCRDRIKTFCEQYPNDSRCKKLEISYCGDNLDDATCRQRIMQACNLSYAGNATLNDTGFQITEQICEKLGNLYEKKIDNTSKVFKNLPAWYTKITEKLRENRNRIVANAPGGHGGED